MQKHNDRNLFFSHKLYDVSYSSQIFKLKPNLYVGKENLTKANWTD